MLPRHRLSPAGRRGVVLVLILGMLGLLALIGVTFASISGQSLIGARNFSAGVAFPDFQEVMDYGLEQLINDTNNPVSALRGHSLKRDMYGNDSTTYGNGSTNQYIGNYLAQLPFLGNFPTLNYQPLTFQAAQYYNGSSPAFLQQYQQIPDPNNGSNHFAYHYVQYRTNIPIGNQANGATYGLQFGRAPSSTTTTSSPYSGWMLRLAPVAPNASGSGLYQFGGVAQTFEVLEDDFTGQLAFATDPNTGLVMHVLTLSMPDALPVTASEATPVLPPGTTTTASSPQGVTVPLVEPPTPGTPFVDPTLGLVYSSGPFVLDGRFQNAFNGPGLMSYAQYGNFLFNGVGNNATIGTVGDPNFYGMDEDYDAVDLENWFLGLQSADGTIVIPSFHRPGILIFQRDTNGNPIGDDWQNPGPNRTTTAPVSANASRAKILRRRQFDMAAGFPADPIPDPQTGKITYDVDNDGDGTTDSVWLDLGYPTQRDPVTGKSFKPMFAFTVLGLNGRLPLNTVGNLQGRFYPNGSNTFGTNQLFGTPTNLSTTIQYTDPVSGTVSNFGPYTAGYPTFLHTSHLGASPSEVNPMYAFSTVNSKQLPPPATGTNVINPLPSYAGGSELQRLLTGARDPLTGTPYAGRWGEPELIPGGLLATYGVANLNSIVRAGRSYPLNADGRDGDYDALDFYPPYYHDTTTPGNSTYPEQAPSASTNSVSDYLDTFSLGFLLPSERKRHFVTPEDSLGTGRLFKYNFGMIGGGATALPTTLPNYPNNPSDYGLGGDNYGRVTPFMYNRPAGMPSVPAVATPTIPDGYSYAVSTVTPPPRFFNTPGVYPAQATNLLHAYEAARNPAGSRFWQTTAPTGAMYPAGPTDPVTGGTAYAAGTFPPNGFPFVWDTMPYFWGAMPWNNNNFATPTSGTQTSFYPQAIPTFDGSVNSTDPTQVSDSNGFPQFPPPVDPMGAMPVSGSSLPIVYGLYPGMPFANNPYAAPNAPTLFPMGTPLVVGGGALAMGEADQLNLYTPRPYDAPFGPHDLEWLYRVNDVDGPSLSSRLSYLVPNVFGPNQVDPNGSIMGNRLFSVDSWDVSSYSWSPDNFPGFTGDLYGAFGNNSRFGPVFNPDQNVGIGDSASFAKLDANVIPPLASRYYSPLSQPPGVTTPPVPPALYSGTPGSGMPYPTPSLAHRGKKINLNYPFPPQAYIGPFSGGAGEPVRQKWIRETYETLKAILPPKSVDTPEELAQLSQFVVNIVDFRDPDSIVTKFVNTDVIVQTPASASAPAIYSFNTGNNLNDPTIWTGTNGLPGYISLPAPWSPPTVYPTPVAPFDPTATATDGTYLTQYGMEYPPVAITEVLAFQFNRATGTAVTTSAPAQRLFIELINTLSTDGNNGQSGPVTGPFGPPGILPIEDLDLQGWKFWIGKDTPAGRPDPLTGQPAFKNMLSSTHIMIAGQTASTTVTPNLPNVSAGIPPRVPALRINGPNGANGYYVLSNVLTGATEASPPPVEFPYLANADTTSMAATDIFFPPYDTTVSSPIQANNYYWLYLTRPVNPADTNSDDVVVDSFRFAYLDSGWTVTPPNTIVPSALQEIYSLERMQPYRGGHIVPPGTSMTYPTVPGAYGYSEQTFAPATSGYRGQYGGVSSTPAIYQGLGKGLGGGTGDNWDYLPFHDRDFSSVAELMLVPGCPPGLFTKQFVEVRAQLINAAHKTTQTTPPAKASTLAAPAKAVVPTFPYLPDEFYYTAEGQSVVDNPPMSTTDTNHPVVGWTTNAGWYKMFEVFEVPSSVAGSIGPVAAGQNFDWYRQDRRPGQINLNLIIDEEVFFGLMDDPRLNSSTVSSAYPSLIQATAPNYVTPSLIPFVSGQANLVTGAVASTPVIVTQIDAYGTPTTNAQGNSAQHQDWGCYPMLSRGYNAYNLTTTSQQTLMKSSFSDFLKLRHGGSGFMFAYGTGSPGTPTNIPPPPTDGANTNLAVANERPFRSFSFPDIGYTLMRPANLPPSWYTATDDNGNPQLPNPVPLPPNNPAALYPTLPTTTPAYVVSYGIAMPSMPPTPNDNIYIDPGIKNPYVVDPTVTNPQPPPIPPRRLFQIPDVSLPPITAANTSNASEYGDPSINTLPTNVLPTPTSPTANTYYPTTNPYFALSNSSIDLVDNTIYGLGFQLGNNSAGPGTDYRQHPYFRNELMSKMMNLTTVRTHQYAVWITVGFFEVIQPGNPNVALSNPLGAIDKLGAEVGLSSGQNTRYRGFFILDRSLATGFNPYSPGDFRDVITYRRRIE